MPTFINEYANIKVETHNKKDTYDSELRNTMIYNCDCYYGTAPNTDSGTDETIAAYEINGTFFVEISTTGFYKKETYKLFSFEAFYGGN